MQGRAAGSLRSPRLAIFAVSSIMSTEDSVQFPDEATRGSWRSAVEAAERTSTETFDLASLWPRLRAGDTAVLDAFSTLERVYLILAPTISALPRPPRTQRALDLLERVLLGAAQKEVSFDFGMSPSCVAQTLTRALGALGLGGTPSKVPVLLAMAAHAARAPASTYAARCFDVRAGNTPYTAVSAKRPDSCLANVLSRTEFTVARLLIEGNSHGQISAIRGKSERTIANQLAAAFKKLGVSSRAELLRHVITRHAAHAHTHGE